MNKRLLQAALDRRDGARHLAGDEGLAADRALVVEQDAVRGVHAVGLAVVHRDPVGIELGDGVGAARVERRGLALRRLLDLAVQLRGRGLVEARRLSRMRRMRIASSSRSVPERVGIGGVFRRLEAHLHVALRREVVDLGRLDLLDQANEVGRVGQIAVVQEEIGADASCGSA